MKASRKDIKTLGRLQKRPDFLRVQKDGRKWISKGVVLQVCPNEKQGRRLGLTVTKKTEPLAVGRNRIRRRLRAVAFEVLPMCAADHYDYVLIGRADSATKPYEDLVNDLKWCLKK